MIGLGLALLAGYGTFLLYTALVLGWRGLRLAPRTSAPSPSAGARRRAWTATWGLDGADLREVAAVLCVIAAGGTATGAVVFGPGPAALVVGLLAAGLVLGSYRARRHRRRVAAFEAWPRLIEEIRVLTSSSGRSIPHALFDVGARGPQELRPDFEAAHREWLLSTDLERSLVVLRSRLADPTADAVCETLVVAHELGGAQLDARLRALAEDRRLDLQGRKDAAARQAGARFARRFVLLVPCGMALAGLGIGDGRAAYATSFGQAMVVLSILLVAICWWWAGRIMSVPEADRVFAP